MCRFSHWTKEFFNKTSSEKCVLLTAGTDLKFTKKNVYHIVENLEELTLKLFPYENEPVVRRGTSEASGNRTS